MPILVGWNALTFLLPSLSGSVTEEKVVNERPTVTEKVPAVDRRIEIQPAEDDDGEGYRKN